jgi:hypothetical protein
MAYINIISPQPIWLFMLLLLCLLWQHRDKLILYIWI